MITLWIGSAIQAGASHINTLMQNRANKKINEANLEFQQQANEQNIQLQRDINQQNLDQQWKMWESTNEYNHPAAQMERYKESGLNPNLIYGQSNTAQMNNVGTAQAPKVEAKQNAFYRKAYDTGVFFDLLQKQEAIQQQKLQNDLLQQTIDDKINQSRIQTQQMLMNLSKTAAEIYNIGADTFLKQLDGDLKIFERDVMNPLRETSTQLDNKIKGNQVVTSAQQIDINKAQMKLWEMEYQLNYAKMVLTYAQTDHEMAKIGLTEASKGEAYARINKMQEDINIAYEELGIKKESASWDNTLKSQQAEYNFLDLNNPFADVPVLGNWMKGAAKTLNGLIIKPITNLINKNK